MNCHIYILFRQKKSLAFVPKIHFWPPNYFERHVIEEKSKKPPKYLTSEIFAKTLAPIISLADCRIVEFWSSADSYQSWNCLMSSNTVPDQYQSIDSYPPSFSSNTTTKFVWLLALHARTELIQILYACFLQ